MRNQCHWLALALAVLAAALAIGLTLARQSVESIPAVSAADCTSTHGDYCSPQCCGQCHPANLQAWSHTSHAVALTDPAFQVQLQRESDPGECLVCHTTGYDPAAGRYALAGVTCEACHQPYRAGHSAESMAISAPEQLCGRCHAGQLHQWDVGLHGEPGQSCTDCHTVHSG